MRSQGARRQVCGQRACTSVAKIGAIVNNQRGQRVKVHVARAERWRQCGCRATCGHRCVHGCCVVASEQADERHTRPRVELRIDIRERDEVPVGKLAEGEESTKVGHN